MPVTFIFCWQQPNAKPALDLDAQRAWAHRQIAEIETKKHDLFYLLAELDSRFPSRNKYFRDNRELIHHLFGHIVPNPSDTLWYDPRQLHVQIDLLSLIYLNWCIFFFLVISSVGAFVVEEEDSINAWYMDCLQCLPLGCIWIGMDGKRCLLISLELVASYLI